MKAAATKTARGMKATATVETTTTATVETASAATVETTPATTVETAPATTVETTATATAATAMARLGYACEREPHHCARQNSSKR